MIPMSPAPLAEIPIHDGEAALVACRALGITGTRVEILRIVLAQKEVTTSQLMQALGLTRNGVFQHLRVLEECGFITARHATHPRGSGPITYWSADVSEVTYAVEALVSHLLTGRTD